VAGCESAVSRCLDLGDTQGVWGRGMVLEQVSDRVECDSELLRGVGEGTTACVNEAVQRRDVDQRRVVSGEVEVVEQAGGWLPFHGFVADAAACQEVLSSLAEVRGDVGSEMGGEMQQPIPRVGRVDSERGRCPVGRHPADLLEEQASCESQTALPAGEKPGLLAEVMPLLVGEQVAVVEVTAAVVVGAMLETCG
jgi:hypothetical protein